MPATRMQWALLLEGGAFVLLVLAPVLVALTDVHWLGVLGLLAMAALIAGGVVAFLAVLRDGERSLLAYVLLLPGALALFFVIGEFAFPH